MRVTKNKTKNGLSFYIIRSVGGGSEIIRVNKGQWEIEESFRIMKDDFDARPVYVQRDDRIKAHFMTCFIYPLREKKSMNKPHKRDVFNVCGAWAFYQLSKA